VSAPQEDIQTAQQDIIDSFQFFDDWMDRYQYIIDLGGELPEFPESGMVDANKVEGCQSQVWLVSTVEGDRLHFRATSDAAIVRGLIALLLRLYSGRTPREIVDTPPDFIQAIGLDQHLSPNRGNGLRAMIERMKAEAREHLSG